MSNRLSSTPGCVRIAVQRDVRLPAAGHGHRPVGRRRHFRCHGAGGKGGDERRPCGCRLGEEYRRWIRRGRGRGGGYLRLVGDDAITIAVGRGHHLGHRERHGGNRDEGTAGDESAAAGGGEPSGRARARPRPPPPPAPPARRSGARVVRRDQAQVASFGASSGSPRAAANVCRARWRHVLTVPWSTRRVSAISAVV